MSDAKRDNKSRKVRRHVARRLVGRLPGINGSPPQTF